VIDLHTHTLLSDGELLPEELVRRCEVAGYRAVAVTDHVGLSNVGFVVEAAVRMCDSMRGIGAVEALPGAELTHVRPELAERTVRAAREAGARLVLGHGETISEPVLPGSNRAYIEAGLEILAHPGLISLEDARRAAELGVCLEISGRKGHSLTNGHVALMARRAGARLVFGTDAHELGDLMTRARAEQVALGAGMTPEEVAAMFRQAEDVFRRSAAH
jgi:histidinol phosphatase-like PHP family hydrolase